MTQAYICDAVRTPVGRYGGALSSVRADDLGAVPLKALMERRLKRTYSASTHHLCSHQLPCSPDLDIASSGHLQMLCLLIALR